MLTSPSTYMLNTAYWPFHSFWLLQTFSHKLGVGFFGTSSWLFLKFWRKKKPFKRRIFRTNKQKLFTNFYPWNIFSGFRLQLYKHRFTIGRVFFIWSARQRCDINHHSCLYLSQKSMGISNVTELLVMREQEARMKDDKDWFCPF